MSSQPVPIASRSRRLLVVASAIAWQFAARPSDATMPDPAGSVPPAVARAFDAGIFDLPARSQSALGVPPQSRWIVPVVMVGFSDAPLTRTAAEFNTALFDTTNATLTGSVYDYYNQVSGGRVRVTGYVVATVNLPNRRADYADNTYGLSFSRTPANIYGMVRDALIACQAGVDWSPFDQDHNGEVDILWVLHQGVGGERSADNSTIWSITSAMNSQWRFGDIFETSQLLPGSSTQHYRIRRFSTLPELSSIDAGKRAEIGTFCHEFGHALGLPDLYDATTIPLPYQNAGPGFWSLMSTGSFGGSGLTPERPARLDAWSMLYLGWAQSFRPTSDTLVTLDPIADGGPVLELWSQGTSYPEHFLIENRAQESFDSTLPNHGLLIYHVDESQIQARISGNRVNAMPFPALVVVEGDGRFDLVNGVNRGDASDPIPGSTGRTSLTDETSPGFASFSGAYTDLAMGAVQTIGSSVRFQLQVSPPGWLAPTDASPPDLYQLDSSRPGRWAVTDDERRIFAVRSSLVGGVPEVFLHTRLAGQWQEPEMISNSTGGSWDPSIALLPGGDLAVVWTDSRNGRLRIYYRARVRGVWTPEQSISGVSGDSHHAAVGADGRGMVEVAWLNELGGTRQLMFKRFGYLSPFGTPVPVTFAGESPDPPSLAVHPNGSSYLVWPDRSLGPARLYFARFHPDSGVSSKLPLTGFADGAQLTASAAVDTAGTLHTVWQVANGALNELHYQIRRRATVPPWPADTTIVTAGNLVQYPSIACDESLGVHVAYEDWASELPRARYKLRSPRRGWEVVPTTVSATGEGGILPIPLPQSPYEMTALYVAQTADDAHIRERQRVLGASGTTSVPRESAGTSIRIGPNPVRAGATVRLSGEIEAPGGWLDVFDLSGRRVTSVAVETAGRRFTATLDPTSTGRWPGGVYFARVRGTTLCSRFVVLR